MNPIDDPRLFLKSLFDAAVQRALPEAQMAAWLPPPPRGRTLVLGAGKAAGSMALALDRLWPAQAPLSGLVVTRYGHVPAQALGARGRIEVVQAAHPVPRATFRPADMTCVKHRRRARRHGAPILVPDGTKTMSTVQLNLETDDVVLPPARTEEIGRAHV